MTERVVRLALAAGRRAADLIIAIPLCGTDKREPHILGRKFAVAHLTPTVNPHPMKRVRLIPGILCVALSLGVAGCGPKKEPAPPVPKVTAKEKEPAPPAPKATAKESAAKKTALALPKLGEAPAWKLTDVDGKVVSSADLKGKVMVVDFWATWCGPCRQEIPGYIELAKKYGKDGLVIVGVSLDQEGPEVVKAFGKKFAVNYPLVMADEEVQKAFGGLEVIPTTFLIDREGQVRDRKIGAVETAEYEQRILSVLN